MRHSLRRCRVGGMWWCMTPKILTCSQHMACFAHPCRRVMLPGGRDVVLSDTVGFISDLPHALVEAFRVRGSGWAVAAENVALLGLCMWKRPGSAVQALQAAQTSLGCSAGEGGRQTCKRCWRDPEK